MKVKNFISAVAVVVSLSVFGAPVFSVAAPKYACDRAAWSIT